MTIVSLSYLVMIMIGAIIYYVMPKKAQWVILLCISLAFYYFAAEPLSILYIVFTTTTIYFSSHAACRLRKRQKYVGGGITAFAIISNVLLWFALKGVDLWGQFTSYRFSVISALGMGYYTLQAIGYLLDCAWGTEEPLKNPLKLFLFLTFFPQLTTGPISRFDQLKSLYEPHHFSYQNLTFGAQRILWGFFKKLVLADRLGILVSGLSAQSSVFTGFYAWILLLLFPLQMYLDFSGCMDIVIGTAEIFDITLPENFRNPFLSETSREFWTRWHITLGSWARDYVFYPFLKAEPVVRFSAFLKKHIGKKAGKFIVTTMASFLLWMVMGIWHGGIRYIVGVSLWYWAVMTLSDGLSPVFSGTAKKLRINTEAFSWHLFRKIRTYLIYSVGAIFFLAGVQGGFSILSSALSVFTGGANPWLMTEPGIASFGLTSAEGILLLLGVVGVLAVDLLNEKRGSVRTLVAGQNLVFRWMLWILLLVLVVICGIYGEGYDASSFIYQGF